MVLNMVAHLAQLALSVEFGPTWGYLQKLTPAVSLRGNASGVSIIFLVFLCGFSQVNFDLPV
jgi:hypothetical protein